MGTLSWLIKLCTERAIHARANPGSVLGLSALCAWLVAAQDGVVTDQLRVDGRTGCIGTAISRYSEPDQAVLSIVPSILLLAALEFLVARLVGLSQERDQGRRPRVLAAICWTAALAASAWVAARVDSSPTPSLDIGQGGPLQVSIAVVLIYLGSFAAYTVVEELFFRGAMWRVARQNFGARGGAVIVFVVFVAVHPVDHWFGVAPGGILLGWLRVRYRSLLVPVGAHLGWNAVVAANAWGLF